MNKLNYNDSRKQKSNKKSSVQHSSVSNSNNKQRKSAQDNKRHKKQETYTQKISTGLNNFKKNVSYMRKQKEIENKRKKERQREIDREQRVKEQRIKREREAKLRRQQIIKEEQKNSQKSSLRETNYQNKRKPIQANSKKRSNLSQSQERQIRRDNYERNRQLHEKQQERVYNDKLKREHREQKELEKQLKNQEKQAKRSTQRAKKRNKKMQKLDLFSIRAGMDMPFLILTLVLLAIGLVMMFSASYANAYYVYNDSYKFIKSQLPMAILGVILMIAISYVDYHHLKKLSTPALILSFALLVVVLLMPAMNEVHRWIQLGSFSFQASEITKFALILFFSVYISKHFNMMDTFREGILPFLLVLGPTIILLLLEPHLSCTVIVVLLTAILMFIGGVQLKWFAGALGIVATACLYLVMFTDKLTYANDRISGWLDPLTYINNSQWQDTWQTRNSLYAIGSGGMFGLGLGNSRQKYMYLPEPQNDFVFAIVCEELGYIGAIIVVLLFALLVWRGITVSMRAQDKFGMILGIGIVSQVGIQVFLNIAVVTNTIPNTGISLPFFSYGGTSLIMLLMQMGVVLSISRTSNIQKV